MDKIYSLYLIENRFKKKIDKIYSLKIGFSRKWIKFIL